MQPQVLTEAPGQYRLGRETGDAGNFIDPEVSVGGIHDVQPLGREVGVERSAVVGGRQLYAPGFSLTDVHMQQALRINEVGSTVVIAV